MQVVQLSALFAFYFSVKGGACTEICLRLPSSTLLAPLYTKLSTTNHDDDTGPQISNRQQIQQYCQDNEGGTRSMERLLVGHMTASMKASTPKLIDAHHLQFWFSPTSGPSDHICSLHPTEHLLALSFYRARIRVQAYDLITKKLRRHKRRSK
jgi:hypothetical protein